MKAPHEVTLRDLRGVNPEHTHDNAVIMARSWAEDAVLKMYDERHAEAEYSARCAAHFAGLAIRSARHV